MTRLFIKGIAGLQRNLFGLGLEMLFENVAIVGLAHVEPAQRVHSSEFETQIAGTLERLGLPPNMLQALAGIEERRWGADVQPMILQLRLRKSFSALGDSEVVHRLSHQYFGVS